jgi:heat shock protein 1/8
MSPIGYGLGIDLGTANTCTAVFRDNVTHIVPHNGQNTMPSCVAFTDTCRLVGSAAKAQASANPTNTIFDALRYVGKDFSDPGLRHMTENVPFKVKQEYGRTTFIVEYQGRELVTTPLDILAMVLARAQRDAQNFLGPRIQSSGAIITIPANFNFRQRQVIWDAACLAKINPIRLMSAATATFADYALKTQSTKLRNVLCVDLGAGSLDVAIAIFEFGLAEIKAVNGNNFLDESENLDSLLVNFAASQFRQKWGLDPRKEPRPLRRLRTACEQAKHDLTFQKDTHLFIDNLAGGHDFEFSFKQEIMESCCFNLFKSSLELIRKTLEDARMDSTQIDAVLVTGGLSRMPKFLSLLSQVIDEHKIYKLFNRDEAAARGAAYYAAIILKTVSSELDDFLLIDVAPFSLGIETTENKIEKVLRKNASVPSKKYTDFTTLEQDSYSVSIFEGEQSLARSNLFLARFELPLDTGRSDKATIEVCVSYSTNIDVLVIAKDTKTGKQGQVRLADYLMLPEHELKIKTGEHLEFDTTERHEETRIGARNAAEEYVVSLLDKLATSPDTVATTAKKSLANDLLEWLDVNPGAQEHVFRRKTNILKTRIISVVDVDARTKQSFEQMSPKATRGPAPPFSSPDVSSHPFPDHNNATSIPDSRYEEVLREALEEPLFEPSQASPNSKNELQSESEITHQLNELNAQQTKIDASVSPPLPGSGALGNSDATTTSRVTSPHPRESGINDLFMRASTERFVYTDAEFVHVSAYLRNSGQPAWSTVPRLYTVLRLLDQLYTLDTFIEQGITDIWFPFTATSLPNAISPTLRGKFLDQQQVVLSKSLLFENSSDRKHAHFAQGEPLPFHIIAKLGSGAHGQVDKVMSTVSHREYARKQFRRQRGTSKDAIKSFLIELQVLKRVHHHHCIELVRLPNNIA